MEGFEGRTQNNREGLLQEQRIKSQRRLNGAFTGRHALYLMLFIFGIATAFWYIYFTESEDIIINAMAVETFPADQKIIVIASSELSKLKVDAPLNLIKILVDQAEFVDSEGNAIDKEQIQQNDLIKVYIYRHAPVSDLYVDAYKVELLD